jgi:hypothetical protein
MYWRDSAEKYIFEESYKNVGFSKFGLFVGIELNIPGTLRLMLVVVVCCTLASKRLE